MKLIITWDLDGLSAERAVELAQKWASQRLTRRGEGPLPGPTRVTVAGPPPAKPLPDPSALQLAERRQALGLSQRDLARRAHISQNTVSHVERGRCAPDSRAAQSVRRALDTAEAGQ